MHRGLPLVVSIESVSFSSSESKFGTSVNSAMFGQKEEEERSKGGFVNLQKFRGLTERQNFPLIQGSNEKVPKIKVVTFDEIYNFAFRPKFKGAINLKLF